MKNELLRPRLAAFICAAIFLLFAVAGQTQQPPSNLQVLHNHVRSVINNGQAVPVGQMPVTESMNVAIMLPLRNQAELTSLLNRIYDPSSPDYHHFLSVSEFTDEFGPSERDYQAVIDFAHANGFTVTDTPGNRLLVDINGTVAQIQQAFHVTMRVYQHPTENRTFHSPDREPSLALSVPISHIAGLNDFSIPRPHIKKAAVGQVFHPDAGGSGPSGAFRPSDMRAAYYGGTSLTGSGQSVAVIEFDGYNMADVTGDMGGTSFTVPITNVLIDGASAGSDGDDGEQALDIAQAIGMAPGLSSVRVYIAPGTTSIGVGDTDMFNKIATDNISKSISCSWGWNPDDTAQDDPIFQEYQAQGQTLFVASGDAGAYTGSNATDDSYPAEDVFVTAVGGTDLTTNGAGGPWSSETAWPDSSGGPADNGFALPSWQSGIANSSNGASSTVRNLPDVAAEANFDNILCDDGTCTDNETGGTSYAAPRWAGFIALVNQQSVANGNSTVGFINPTIYAIGLGTSFTSDFHDITSGNNNNGRGKSFNAVTGYDLVTGWGSPNGQNLINALAGAAAPPTTVTLTPASLAFGNQTVNTTSAAETITLTNGTSSAVTITSIAASGSFAETNTCGTSVAAGGTCTISVTFTPTATGAASGTVTVTDSASNSPQTASLSGTGVAAGGAVTLTPTSVAFGSEARGSTSASHTLTLANGSSSTLTISSITLSNSSFEGTTTCGSSLAAGATCTITLEFRPRTTGTITGTLTVTDNASNSPQTASLSGTGTRR
ncbi:MAG TPA: choice-of-anchor D domain-containing protein [Terriglobales bacterium]